MCEQGLCLFGPDCAPWGMPARHTSQKNYMNAFGAMHLNFVNFGNQMVSLCLATEIPTNHIDQRCFFCWEKYNGCFVSEVHPYLHVASS